MNKKIFFLSFRFESFIFKRPIYYLFIFNSFILIPALVFIEWNAPLLSELKLWYPVEILDSAGADFRLLLVTRWRCVGDVGVAVLEEVPDEGLVAFEILLVEADRGGGSGLARLPFLPELGVGGAVNFLGSFCDVGGVARTKLFLSICSWTDNVFTKNKYESVGPGFESQ